MCPAAGADEAASYLVLVTYRDDGEARLAPVVRYFEELMHYCYEVLPAWRG